MRTICLHYNYINPQHKSKWAMIVPVSCNICGGTIGNLFPEMFRYLSDLARPVTFLGNSESEIRLFLKIKCVRLGSSVPMDSGIKLRTLLLRSSSARFLNCNTVSGRVSIKLLHRTSFLIPVFLKVKKYL